MIRLPPPTRVKGVGRHNKIFMFFLNVCSFNQLQVHRQIVWQGWFDHVCHHDRVGHIETEVATHDNFLIEIN